ASLNKYVCRLLYGTARNFGCRVSLLRENSLYSHAHNRRCWSPVLPCHRSEDLIQMCNLSRLSLEETTMNNAIHRRRFLNETGVALFALCSSRLVGEEPVKVPTAGEWLERLVSDAPLTMRFQGTTAEECRKWQAEFAARLRALLGPHVPPPKWKTTVER